MSATSNPFSPGLYHIYNVASADNSALEPTVVCNIMRLFQERFLYASTDGWFFSGKSRQPTHWNRSRLSMRGETKFRKVEGG